MFFDLIKKHGQKVSSEKEENAKSEDDIDGIEQLEIINLLFEGNE